MGGINICSVRCFDSLVVVVVDNKGFFIDHHPTYKQFYARRFVVYIVPDLRGEKEAKGDDCVLRAHEFCFPSQQEGGNKAGNYYYEK